jgi:hypothetical protein
MRAGSEPAVGKERSSARIPCFATSESGRVLTPAAPMFIPTTGEAAASSSAAAIPNASAGRRMTRRTIAPQKRLSWASSFSISRATNGRRRRLIRSPSRLSTAGRRVRAATTETIPTRIAPVARLRMIVFCTSRSPTIASTKALPLKRTARLAVAPVAAIASSFERPRERSSRKRETTKRA